MTTLFQSGATIVEEFYFLHCRERDIQPTWYNSLHDLPSCRSGTEGGYFRFAPNERKWCSPLAYATSLVTDLDAWDHQERHCRISFAMLEANSTIEHFPASWLIFGHQPVYFLGASMRALLTPLLRWAECSRSFAGVANTLLEQKLQGTSCLWNSQPQQKRLEAVANQVALVPSTVRVAARYSMPRGTWIVTMHFKCSIITPPTIQKNSQTNRYNTGMCHLIWKRPGEVVWRNIGMIQKPKPTTLKAHSEARSFSLKVK